MIDKQNSNGMLSFLRGCGFGNGNVARKVLEEFMPSAFRRRYARLFEQREENTRTYNAAEKKLEAIIDEIKKSLSTVDGNREKNVWDYWRSRDISHALLTCHVMTSAPVDGEVDIEFHDNGCLAEKITVSAPSWKKMKCVIAHGRKLCADWRKVNFEYKAMDNIVSSFMDSATQAFFEWEQEESIRRVIKAGHGKAKELRGMFAKASTKHENAKAEDKVK